MCRFFFGLLVVLGLFGLVAVIGGETAFVWALIVGVVGGGTGLLFLPLTRRGSQFAYRKWMLRQTLFVILVIGGPTALAFYLIVHVTWSTDAITVALVGLGLAVALSTYALGWAIAPPTRRRGWLQQHYPAVATAIQRYEQAQDQLEDYTPALRIDGTATS